jgi:AAT family amino acid transporter
MSGANSGIYSSGRMLFKLSRDGQTAKALSKISSHQVPYISIFAISGGILLGLILNTVFSAYSKSTANLFVLVYSSSVLPGMVPWFVILVSELRFRAANKDLMVTHPFKMPLYPITNYIALLSLIVIVIFMFINPDTRISVSIGAGFLILLSIIYFIQAHKSHND